MIPPDTHPLMLLFQIGVNAFTTVLPCLNICGVPKAVDLGRQVLDADADADGVDDDDDDGDDDWDDDYFDRGGRGGDSLAVSAVKSARVETELAISFWFIPRVKFTFRRHVPRLHRLLPDDPVRADGDLRLVELGVDDGSCTRRSLATASRRRWSSSSSCGSPHRPLHRGEGKPAAGGTRAYFSDLWNQIDFVTVVIMFGASPSASSSGSTRRASPTRVASFPTTRTACST